MKQRRTTTTLTWESVKRAADHQVRLKEPVSGFKGNLEKISVACLQDEALFFLQWDLHYQCRNTVNIYHVCMKYSTVKIFTLLYLLCN